MRKSSRAAWPVLVVNVVSPSPEAFPGLPNLKKSIATNKRRLKVLAGSGPTSFKKINATQSNSSAGSSRSLPNSLLTKWCLKEDAEREDIHSSQRRGEHA